LNSNSLFTPTPEFEIFNCQRNIMSGKGQNSSSGASGKSGSSGNSFTPYETTGRGTNSQGNNWDTRTQPAGDAYHYSNNDGSYYYSNGDGSKYHNSGTGEAKYTAPDGNVYKK
ncbi:hypothetical protein PVAG01_04156, partial [Phlyctema vagabunda]